jgi:hypothetical protein
LKAHIYNLESISRCIERPVVNNKAIQKDIDAALKALAKVQHSLYIAVKSDFTKFFNSELLLIYLGDLEHQKGNADDE